MNATKPIAFVAAALLSSAAFAGGDDPAHGGKSMKTADQKFQQLDSNSDKQLSKTEAYSDQSLAAVFESVDADSDGYISEREYTAYAADEGEAATEEWQSESTTRQSTETDTSYDMSDRY
jgi:hypothetical protein